MPSRPIAVIFPLNLVNLLRPIHACHLIDVFHSDHPNYSFHRIRLSRPIDPIHAVHLEHAVDGLGLRPVKALIFPRFLTTHANCGASAHPPQRSKVALRACTHRRAPPIRTDQLIDVFTQTQTT